MTDRVRYLLRGATPLETVESSIVPQRDQWVQIHGEEYQVYRVVHDADRTEGHRATVWVWQPEGDEADAYIRALVGRALRSQRADARDDEEADPDAPAEERVIDPDEDVELRLFGP